MCPAVPTTIWRGAVMGAERRGGLFADALDLLDLLLVVLAEEKVPFGAALRYLALLRSDLAADVFLDLILFQKLGFEDLQHLQANVVGVAQELDTIVVLEGVDEEMRQVHAPLVAQSH